MVPRNINSREMQVLWPQNCPTEIIQVECVAVRAHLYDTFFYDTRESFLRLIWFASDWSESEITHEAFWCMIRVKRKKIRIRQEVFFFFTSFALRVIRIGEFVQLDVACSWNRSKATQTWAVVVDCFTAEIHPSRETGPPEQPQREARRPLPQSKPSAAPKKLQGRRIPSFSSLYASRTTRAPTRSRFRSEVRSLYPRRCCPCGASGLRQPPNTSQER